MINLLLVVLMTLSEFNVVHSHGLHLVPDLCQLLAVFRIPVFCHSHCFPDSLHLLQTSPCPRPQGYKNLFRHLSWDPHPMALFHQIPA